MTKNTISQPQTELEMYNLTRSYNEMRWSKKKECLSNMFDEMACKHGTVVVGNHVYRHNGQKCIRNHSMEMCLDCYEERLRELKQEFSNKQVQIMRKRSAWYLEVGTVQDIDENGMMKVQFPNEDGTISFSSCEIKEC